jgi:hypothetical protein
MKSCRKRETCLRPSLIQCWMKTREDTHEQGPSIWSEEADLLLWSEMYGQTLLVRLFTLVLFWLSLCIPRTLSFRIRWESKTKIANKKELKGKLIKSPEKSGEEPEHVVTVDGRKTDFIFVGSSTTHTSSFSCNGDDYLCFFLLLSRHSQHHLLSRLCMSFPLPLFSTFER